MALSFVARAGLGLIVAAGLAGSGPALAEQVDGADQGLAAASLATGETREAIELLKAELKEAPNDPALLINLGIAHAQMGDEVEARARFEAAMASREVIELDTADGRTTDSRVLARKAISMLERGEFRPTPRQVETLTLRNR